MAVYSRRRSINRIVSRGVPFVQRYGPKALKIAKEGYNIYRQNAQSSKKGKSSAPAPITAESDWRGVYRRKPFPRRRRRSWVRFVRKTKAVIAKSLAPSFLVRLRQVRAQSASGKQARIVNHTVLGSASLFSESSNDLFRIHERLENLKSQPATGSTIGEFSPDRFIVSGWMCETQLVNQGTTTVYVDCYYWRSKRDWTEIGDGEFGGSNVDSLLTNLLANQKTNIPLGGSSLQPDDYGVTPFQSGTFSKYVQIYKKTRIKLGVGATAQLETRSGRNHYINWLYAQNATFLRGKTEGIYMICYGIPTNSDQTSAPVDVRGTTNVNYTYRIVQTSTETGGTTQA